MADTPVMNRSQKQVYNQCLRLLSEKKERKDKENNFKNPQAGPSRRYTVKGEKIHINI
jgi:hypothetical protein